MRWGLAVISSVCLLGLALGTASAEPPITSRDYAIDFYEGTALGDTRMVGMGGAGIALIVGSAGTLLNASAPAVRETTDTDRWSWDYHLDYLDGRFSTDYDNSGTVVSTAANGDADSGASLVTLGLGGRYGSWGVAITSTIQSAPLAGSLDLVARAVRFRLGVAKFVERIDTSIGVGVQSVAFQIHARDDEELFNISGGGLLAGATWTPRMRDFRAGLSLESAIIGGNVQAAACDPAACMVDGGPSYILPSQVESAGRLGFGGAYRWSPTAWNQLVGGHFRDERSLTVAADLWITGPTQQGYGIEKFGMQELQRSGSHTSVGARVGAEVEALPGRLRLRAGSYWEPERFTDVGGRLHGTFGIDVRVFEFQLWGRRRGRLGLTTDLAKRYRNLAVSIGLWH